MSKNKNHYVILTLQLTVRSIQECKANREETSNWSGGHESTIRVERIQCHCAFAHVSHSLSHANKHQTDLIFVVVASQLTQHRNQTSIICAGTNQSHSKNSIVCGIRIGIVTKFAQRLQNIQLRVRHTAQSQRQWNSTTNNGLSITNLNQAN